MCWLYRDARDKPATNDQESLKPPVDYTQDIYILRTHKKDNLGGRFKPYFILLDNEKPTELGPIPPEEDRWMIEFNTTDNQRKFRVFVTREN
jgi:hypothetical protein